MMYYKRILCSLISLVPVTFAFTVAPLVGVQKRQCNTVVHAEGPRLENVPDEETVIPVPFIDKQGNCFIDCHCDTTVVLDGVQYTIGVPCDHAVALCYFDESEELIPVELESAMMDDVYPIAESIVEDEFGEELVLQRTPQTLTLMGELEDIDEEIEFRDEEESEGADELLEDVDLLLSFMHRDKEFGLVRILEPVLLVAKPHKDADKRYLLTPEESEKVMPMLEKMYLDYLTSAQKKDLSP